MPSRADRPDDIDFFFSSRIRHTISTRDWSSDVCSSDLSDVQGGCLIVKSQELLDKLLHVREILGAVASPFGSWLILRGLRSLPCRMERHSANGNAVAARSEERRVGKRRKCGPGNGI